MTRHIPVVLLALALASPTSAQSQASSRTATRVAPFSADYPCVPYHDAAYSGGPQRIPGRLQNEFYDVMNISDAEKRSGAEEGHCYHDTDHENKGSGILNGTGSYLKEFRMFESPGISYTKFHNANVAVDDNSYNLVVPDSNSLYLGWTDTNEWVNYTVDVAERGEYSITTMYTSQHGGHISLSVNGTDVTGPIEVMSTRVAADTVQWRQAHHWNRATIVPRVHLEAGRQLLTLHVLEQPGFNFDYMDFVRLR